MFSPFPPPVAPALAEYRIRNVFPQRARFVAWAMVLVAAGWGTDVVQAHGPNWTSLALRLAWVLLLGRMWWVLRRGPIETIIATGLAAVGGSALLFVALVVVTGGRDSPLFPYLYVLATVLPLLHVERRAVGLAASAGLLVGVLVLLGLGGAGVTELAAAAQTAAMVFATAWFLSRAVALSLQKSETAVLELQDAIAAVRTLRGLVAQCAWCRRVRDDAGYWQRIEAFVARHTGAEFTHGVCPDCVTTHFPDGAPAARE